MGSRDSRRPILQTCNVVVVMIAETDIVPTSSAQFFVVGTLLIVISPSRTLVLLSRSILYRCVSYWVLIPIDLSKNST